MKRVCVYCGSRRGSAEVFAEAAKELGRALVERGLELVYGGGKVGLMGIIADAVLAAGGHVIGVIPEHLATIELTHPDVPDMRVVKSMHERKALMIELSDAFVAMPGGFGTMEELFEVLCWRQLGLHSSPVAVLNAGGFYDDLDRFVNRMVSAEFLCSSNAESVIMNADVAPLLDRLKSWKPDQNA